MQKLKRLQLLLQLTLLLLDIMQQKLKSLLLYLLPKRQLLPRLALLQRLTLALRKQSLLLQ